MARAALLGLFVLLSAGCVNAEAARAYRALPQGEQTAWDACYAMVRGRSCAGFKDVAAEVCMDDIGDRYALLPNTAARRETLVALGCPAPVVDAALRR